MCGASCFFCGWRDAVGGTARVPEGGEKGGRQRERISARAGTPSGDAAGFVRGMENLTPEGEDIVPGKDSVGGYN